MRIETGRKTSRSVGGWTRSGCTLTLAALVALMATQASAQISVSNTSGLAFGSIVPGSSGGTVTVPYDGSSRNCSAEVVCIPQNPGSAAGFDVTGELTGGNYSITLPSSPVTLSNTAGESMTVDSFIDSENGSGSLSVGGNGSFTVGATLNVGANQPSGGYSGSFDVTVEYE